MQSLLSEALGYYHKDDDGTQKQYLTSRLPLLRLVEGTPGQRRYFYKEILTWGIASPDADAFAVYESLFNESDPELVAAAKTAKEEGEYRTNVRPRPLPPMKPQVEPPVLIRPDFSVRLTPVEFGYLQDGRQTKITMQGILADERGHEIAWGNHAAGNSEFGVPLGPRVVIHHRGGEPFRKIFEADERRAFGFGCYDGKYFWLPVSGGNRERAPKGASAPSGAGETVAQLLRIDAADGTIVRVGVEQGLPDVQGSFNTAITAPLEPGRIALVATFGLHRAKRTFIAEIGGNANGPPRVRVVHEAREEYLGTDRRSSEEQARTNPKLNYTPKFVLPFSEPGSPVSTHRPPTDTVPTHLLIARTVTGNPYQDNCLVVELATGKTVITPAEAHGHLAPWDFVIRDGDVGLRRDDAQKHRAAYWATYKKVWRISSADLTKREAVADLVEDDGALYFTKEGILLVGRECWFTEDWSKPFRQVADNEDKFIYTYINEHYYSSELGPLLKAMLPSREVKLYRVELLRNGDAAK
jgi:hypothetical protein